jgi:S-formylglutathione hydrolase FrmB
VVLASALLASVGMVPSHAAAPEPFPCSTAGPVDMSFSVSTSAVPGHPRLRDLTIDAPSVDSYVKATTKPPRLPRAYVLLPAGYNPVATPTRYPVLYLLHGHGGSYADWVAKGNVESIVGSRKLIVVMPDGGYDGFYSDWYGTDPDGHNGSVAPAWETFHLRQLLPWIDAHYNTIPNRAGRAVAGLSMGGEGSMGYPARHPELFSVAGGFSGAVNPDLDWPVGPLAQEQVANLSDGRKPDECIWGDPLTQDVIWQGHDPTELAGNLADVELYLASGTGVPDPSPGAPAFSPTAALTEHGIFQDNVAFTTSLVAHGHPAATMHTNFYPVGTHEWYYWQRDLTQFLSYLDAGLGTASTSPASFSYESGEPSFSVWGWQFSINRAVREFLYLDGVTTAAHGVNVAGFEVHGSGNLTVTTPSGALAPNHAYRVVVADHGTGAAAEPPMAATSNGNGSLTFTVALGPSHTTQQYLFGPAGEAETFAGHHFDVEVQNLPQR